MLHCLTCNNTAGFAFFQINIYLYIYLVSFSKQKKFFQKKFVPIPNEDLFHISVQHLASFHLFYYSLVPKFFCSVGCQPVR